MLRTANHLSRRAARPGVTLVELMVMAAVCLIIMSVLASVFQTGIDAMRQVRSAGDMMDQLRAAGEVMKRDLLAQHFLPEDGKPNQGVGLGDQKFNVPNWPPPRGGFFKIVSPPPLVEGFDLDGLQSTTATNHTLHFTSVLTGGGDQNLYTATGWNPTPPGTAVPISSPAAEIAYFLIQDGGRTTAPGSLSGTTPQHLFMLVRRQRLVAMTPSDAATWLGQGITDPSNADVICGVFQNPTPPPAAPTIYTMANLKTLQSGGRLGLPGNTPPNFPYAALSATTPLPRVGDDILLSNVLSFEVKAIWEGSPGTRPFATPAGLAPMGVTDDPTVMISPGVPKFPNTTDAPYDNLGKFGGLFDTWSNPQIRVKGLQIRIRVYDPKMKAARQSTFVLSM